MRVSPRRGFPGFRFPLHPGYRSTSSGTLRNGSPPSRKRRPPGAIAAAILRLATRPRFGVTAIQRADAHRDRNVVWRLARLQLKILGGDVADAQAAGRDFRRRRGNRQRDRLGGSVDAENMPIPDAACDLPGERARTTADLQHPQAGPKGERAHDRQESS